jgi:hypothetical protein
MTAGLGEPVSGTELAARFHRDRCSLSSTTGTPATSSAASLIALDEHR